MLLVAITRHRISNLPTHLAVGSIDLPGSRILTFVTDRWLSQAVIGSDIISVCESPWGSQRSSEVIFSEISVDRSGTKIHLFRSTVSGRPIYYTIRGEEFFCSTHIALLRGFGVPIEEDSRALPEFFVYRYVMPPRTLFKDIKQVVTGSRVRLQYDGSRYEMAGVDNYYPANSENGRADDIDHVAKRTAAILSDSIFLLNSRKSRISMLLSGGIDSSVLFKLCQTKLDLDSAFSTSWPIRDSEDMEKDYACSAAEALGAHHSHYETSVAQYLDGFLQAIAAAEEPVHHLQSVLLYLLFREGLPAAKDIVVSGEGADGVFGSELNNKVFLSEKKLRKVLLSAPIRRFVSCVGYVNDRARKMGSILTEFSKKNLPFSDPDNFIWSDGVYGSFEWTLQYFGVKKTDIIDGRYGAVEPFRDRSVFEIMSLLGLFGEGSVSTAVWSKLGEAQKRIVYYPYNSATLLDYIYTVPWSIKLGKSKNVLRRVAAQLNVPDFILKRPKSGLGIDPRYWAAPGGWFAPLVPLTTSQFSQEEISRLQSAGPEMAMTFWNVLNYSLWKRLVINDEPLETVREELAESISRSSFVR